MAKVKMTLSRNTVTADKLSAGEYAKVVDLESQVSEGLDLEEAVLKIADGSIVSLTTGSIVERELVQYVHVERSRVGDEINIII